MIADLEGSDEIQSTATSRVAAISSEGHRGTMLVMY
ncbi:MAG: hypothetical protein IPN96_04665 [Anaerolineales bacterium]|nr:hypothetical protein [Anaerolineales bacterium]MBK9210465.1 hypothetical protein [Anaerolineales bacterium]